MYMMMYMYVGFHAPKQDLLVYLTVLGVPRVPVPRRLVEEDDEEDVGDVYSDEIIQQLAGVYMYMQYMYIHVLHMYIQ